MLGYRVRFFRALYRLSKYTMARTREWLDMRWFYEGIKNMPSHYKEKCLPFKLLRKQIDRFLDPSVGLAEQIGSFLALQAGDIPSLYPPPARSYVQPEDSSLPQDIFLQVTQFTSLLNLEVEKMNTFLVSTHRLQVRAANVSHATICSQPLS